MVATELVYQTETETATKNELLALDLLRILSNPKFFGGKLGGESSLTREMTTYRKYCQQIGGAIITLNGITQPTALDTKSGAHGLAVADNFPRQLLDDPEDQLKSLVTVSSGQINQILADNIPWTRPKDNLVRDCQDCFDQAANRINKYFGFRYFLSQHLEIKLI